MATKFKVGDAVRYRIYPSGKPAGAFVGEVVQVGDSQAENLGWRLPAGMRVGRSGAVHYWVYWDDVDRAKYSPQCYTARDLAPAGGMPKCGECGEPIERNSRGEWLHVYRLSHSYGHAAKWVADYRVRGRIPADDDFSEDRARFERQAPRPAEPEREELALDDLGIGWLDGFGMGGAR